MMANRMACIMHGRGGAERTAFGGKRGGQDVNIERGGKITALPRGPSKRGYCSIVLLKGEWLASRINVRPRCVFRRFYEACKLLGRRNPVWGKCSPGLTFGQTTYMLILEKIIRIIGELSAKSKRCSASTTCRCRLSTQNKAEKQGSGCQREDEKSRHVEMNCG